MIQIVNFLFQLFSLFSKKAKQREYKWKQLLANIPKKNSGIKRLLIHSASMGEFEQAKPVIDLIKENDKNIEIIASFFSPSGLENQSNYGNIDYYVYMPIDTISNAKLFVNTIQADIAIFVRYDIWFNHLEYFKNSGCKNYLICAAKPTEKLVNRFNFLKFYYRICYNLFDEIFTVGEIHTKYFKDLNINSEIHTLSDTRADRILKIVDSTKNNKIIPTELLKDNITLIAGSSWAKDEELISEAINEINREKFLIRIIYVPHEPTENNLIRIKSLHKKTIYLSTLQNELSIDNIDIIKEKLKDTHIIVDSIGKLLKLYANSDVVYVGCGFGDGVHSVSEPAGYGVPIVCGPNINNMPDAVSLHKLNGLKIIRNTEELKLWFLEIIQNESLRNKMGIICKNYILSSSGSSMKIFEKINESLSK